MLTLKEKALPMVNLKEQIEALDLKTLVQHKDYWRTQNIYLGTKTHN